MENEINILDYYRIIRKRWLWLFFFCAASAAAGFYTAFTSPKIYRAETQLHVFTSGGNRLLGEIPQSFLNLSGLGGGGGSQLDYLEKLLNSDSLALAVAEKIRLDQSSEFSAKSKTQEKTKDKKNAMDKKKKPQKFVFDLKNAETQRLVSNLKNHVEVESDRKDGLTVSCEAQSGQLAADIANAYVKVLRSKMTSKAQKNVKVIKKQLDKVKNDLTGAEDKLKQFQEENKIVVLDKQLEGEVNEYLNLKSEYVRNKMSLEATNKLIQSSGSLEDLAKLEGERIMFETKQGELDNAMQQSDSNLEKYPGNSQKFARLLREVKLQALLFELFSQQYEMEKISQLKEDVDFQVIDPAFPPKKYIKPQKKKILLMFLLVGAAGGVFFVFVMEYVQSAKKNERTT